MIFRQRASGKLLITGILLALLASSCKEPQGVVFREVREFGVDPRTGIHFKVVLYNPNGFSFRINRTQAELLMDGHSLGIARQLESVVLPATGEAAVSCSLKLNAGDIVRLLPSGLGALIGGKPLTLKTIGQSEVSKLLVSKTVRFETEQQVDGKLLKSLF
jgi:LEA14-like dessication related protein